MGFPHKYLTKYAWLSAYTYSWHPEPANNPGKNATKAPGKKPCFIVDPLKLKPELRDTGNLNVQCIQDGVSFATNKLLSRKAGRLNQQLFLKSTSLATIPDLQFQGIKYVRRHLYYCFWLSSLQGHSKETLFPATTISWKVIDRLFKR